MLPSTKGTTMVVQTSPTALSTQAVLSASNPRADPACKDVNRSVIRAGPHRPGRAVRSTESPTSSRPILYVPSAQSAQTVAPPTKPTERTPPATLV